MPQYDALRREVPASRYEHREGAGGRGLLLAAQTPPPARSRLRGMTKRTLSLLPVLATVAAAALLTSCNAASGSFATGDAPETLPRVASHTTAGHCDGRLGDVAVDGDVTVPAGATCELLGTTVEGNVSVGHGA